MDAIYDKLAETRKELASYKEAYEALKVTYEKLLDEKLLSDDWRKSVWWDTGELVLRIPNAETVESMGEVVPNAPTIIVRRRESDGSYRGYRPFVVSVQPLEQVIRVGLTH
jgi:hypothetical protein